MSNCEIDLISQQHSTFHQETGALYLEASHSGNIRGVLVLLNFSHFSSERKETGSLGVTESFSVKAWKTTEHKVHKIWRSLKFCKNFRETGTSLVNYRLLSNKWDCVVIISLNENFWNEKTTVFVIKLPGNYSQDISDSWQFSFSFQQTLTPSLLFFISSEIRGGKRSHAHTWMQI